MPTAVPLHTNTSASRRLRELRIRGILWVGSGLAIGRLWGELARKV